MVGFVLMVRGGYEASSSRTMEAIVISAGEVMESGIMPVGACSARGSCYILDWVDGNTRLPVSMPTPALGGFALVFKPEP